MKVRVGLALGGVLSIGMLAAAPAATAWAAGGYGPTSPTGPSGSPGGYNDVVTAKTFTVAGGSLSATLPGASLDVAVPAGTFPQPVQIEVTSTALPAVNSALSSVGFAGYTAVTGFGIKVLDQDGAPVSGTFSHSVAVTVRGASLGVQGEKVLAFTGPSSAIVIPATLGAGHVTVSLDADPNLAVVNPPVGATTTAPSNATTVNTGLPFSGETDLAVALISAGTALVLVALRRRRVATTK